MCHVGARHEGLHAVEQHRLSRDPAKLLELAGARALPPVPRGDASRRPTSRDRSGGGIAEARGETVRAIVFASRPSFDVPRARALRARRRAPRQHRRHAHLRRFGDAALGLRHRPHLARRVPPRQGRRRVRQRAVDTLEASAAATARSPAGSCTRRPPTTLHEHIELRERQSPPRLSSTASSSASSRPSKPVATRCGVPKPGLRGERLHFHEHRTRALHERRAPRCRCACAARSPRNSSDGFSTGDEPARGHAKDADLVHAAEAILGGAQHAMIERALALEVEHRVHDVLERLRPRDAAALGDVADHEHRGAGILREAHEARRALAHLPDVPRRAFEISR